MITLSKVAFETRAILKWGGIGIGLIILIWIFFALGGTIKKVFFPTPPPPPTVGFGKIQPIKFPPQTEVKDLTYTIDTLSGSLPSFPDRVKVFETTQKEANLLALTNAQKKLNSLGFNSQAVPVDGNVYKWTDRNSVSRTILFDIFSFDFSLTSSYLNDPDVISGKNLPDEKGAIQSGINFLKNLEAYSDDIDEKKTKTNLYSITNSSIVPASSLSNSQLIQVFFFQKDIDKLAVYYSNPNEPPMSLMVSGGNYQPQIVQGKFNHQIISNENETYPIKTASLAFEELQKGKAYIASYQGTDKNISIKKITLGYFIEDQAQLYVTPIFVFEGNDNFVAYLPAITDEWLSN
ncbi:MAG: hypothetical protein A2152_00600 [Candidatus Levybacteria bacterium RBG_16_35_6]|nr:MAG: hypothetical protein A2152_00600 [Candidatus Levybacteria bacterium RBG_16_35_6]